MLRDGITGDWFVSIPLRKESLLANLPPGSALSWVIKARSGKPASQKMPTSPRPRLRTFQRASQDHHLHIMSPLG